MSSHCSDVVQHLIDTGDSGPIHIGPALFREKIYLEEMQELGIVRPSSSAWASPVFLVPKKDGSSRLCVDYRRLNSVTKKDVYPLPRIDDIIDTLGEAKYFTTLDLTSGYWQVELDPTYRAKSAFATHHWRIQRGIQGCKGTPGCSSGSLLSSDD